MTLLAGCDGGGSSTSPTPEPSASTTSPSPASVTSSIEDGTTLLEPSLWSASVESGAGAIGHVDFSVDGQVRWSEEHAPYVFAEGVPFAAWPLGPGPHELSIDVVDLGEGAIASTKVDVKVRVPKRSGPPPGTYLRRVTAADLKRVAPYRDAQHGAFGDPIATGPWSMKVQPSGVIVLDPVPGDEYDPFFLPFSGSSDRFTLYPAAAWLQEHPDSPSLFCQPEQKSSYHWDVSGNFLTIVALDKECADRDELVVGAWLRQSR